MPELTAATGGLALCETHLGAGLADCPAFQTFVGAADAAAAAERIHYNALPVPATDAAEIPPELYAEFRPLALISTDSASGFGLVANAFAEFAERGTLALELEQQYPADLLANPAEAERRFKNAVGAVMEELMDRRNTAGFLALAAIDLVAMFRVAETDAPAQGDWYRAVLRISHGGRGGA